MLVEQTQAQALFLQLAQSLAIPLPDVSETLVTRKPKAPMPCDPDWDVLTSGDHVQLRAWAERLETEQAEKLVRGVGLHDDELVDPN